MSTTSATRPAVLWAQNRKMVFVTIDLRDAQEVRLDLTSTTVSFSARSGGTAYAFDIELNASVAPEDSRKSVTDRNIFLVLHKTGEARWWNNLATRRHDFIKTDLDRWQDEDEEGEEANSSFDMSHFSNMSSPSGMTSFSAMNNDGPGKETD